MQIVIPDELNTYDVLVNDWLVFSKATLATAVARFGGTATSGDAVTSDDVVADDVVVDEDTDQ